MIREFWTENYLSIRDRQCLNFEATGDSRYWIGAEATDGMSLNKVGVIFGPNASGKSNMLKALNNVFRLLFISSDNRNKPVCSEAPFALTADKPTRMYVSFYADNVRYDYTIVYTIDHIVREELLYYPKKSKSLFYERDYVGADSQCRIKFGTSVGIKGRTLDALMENTLNNHSVLSTYGKVALSDDALKLANLYNWIRTHVHGIADSDPELPQLLKEAEKDPRKKWFFLEMLKKADFNITGFSVVSNSDSDKVEFVNSSNDGVFSLSETTQSSGTIKYLQDLRYLYDAISGEYIYMLDELGEDLHYDLLFYYLQVFIANSGKSQLFFTSQEVTLLSEDLLNDNRQIVWFVEKSAETASSEYTRADKLGLHKNNSLYNAYRIGKFGAKPILGSPFINLD